MQLTTSYNLYFWNVALVLEVDPDVNRDTVSSAVYLYVHACMSYNNPAPVTTKLYLRSSYTDLYVHVCA